ncbi:CHRD domain-containing protein [Tsukamurella soli]|uniref:CHRD domain-containing protein n=1 Tax=Tsukamurella soli TaxID=644556 RepID=A0ABP8K2L3_9ACTN
MNRFAAACAVGAAVLTVAACSSSTTQSAGPSSSATSTSAAGAAMAGGAHTVTLAPMPTGTATLTWNAANETVTAALNMSGFTPGGAHAMHIHPGTCADQTKPPSVPFPDITADSSGDVHQTVTSTTKSPGGIPASSYLNIHLAPSATMGAPGSLGFTPIACADIPAGTAHGPVTLKLTAPPDHGRTPAGTATWSYDAATHKLTVDVRATGLPANTSHAVHFHDGSCVKQGAVAYGLPDLKTDGSGGGSEHATITVSGPPPAHGWYVNLHFGPMAKILAGGNPTMEFAPVLCGDVVG